MPPALPAVVVAGPTASGKSRLALALARRTGGQVVNADSMQMYAALRILTARPGGRDAAAAPHLLYGALGPGERCSAGRWRLMALRALAEGDAEGRPSVVVGGSGLYIEALLKGIAPIPQVPEGVRAEADALLAEIGPEGLHARLAEADPELAGRLAPGDRQRVSRGWEVWRATGRALSSWQREAPEGPGSGRRFATVLLDPPRGELREGIARRFDAMLEAGALEEARALAALDLPPRAPVAKAHGVRPLAAHLAGEITLEEAARLSVNETRRYARRQSTWFRHRYRADLRIEQGPAELAREADRTAGRIARAAGTRASAGGPR